MNSDPGADVNRERPAAHGAVPPELNPVVPPPPVFKPDPKVAARVARTRYTMLALTAVLVLAALVVLIGYRPRFVPPKPTSPADTMLLSAGVSAPVQNRQRVAPAAAPVPADPVSKTRSARAAIERLVQSSGEHWLRAQELVPPGVIDSAGAAAALSAVRRAAVLEDSAAAEIAAAGLQASAIRDIAREPDAAGSSYHMSLVYTAADRYLKAVATDVRDRQSYLAVTGEALAALAAGDMGEYETKTNVANSYRYRSDDRQRTIRRLAEQLAQADRELR